MFLNSCSLYICLALEQFYDEQEKILWTLTFFKGGCAAKWSKNVFCQEADTVFSLCKPGGTLNSNFRFTSSL